MSGLLLQAFDRVAQAPGGVARLRELIRTLAVRGKLVPQHSSDEMARETLKRIRGERERLISTGVIKEPKQIKGAGGDELPFEIPSSWTWVPLAELVRVLNGRAYSKQELLDAGPTPVLRVGNLFTSDHWYYSNLRLDPDKLCNSGDLLFAWSASFGPFIWDGPEAIFHYHIWKLDPIAPRLFDTRFFHLFLREKTAELKAAGHGVSMVHLTKERMEKIPVPWPPLAEQARIVARVDELMRLCDALEAQGRLEAEQHSRLLDTLLGTLTDSTTPEELAANWQRVAEHFDLLLDRPEAVDALEQTILQLAVRGLLVPQDPSDEPASVLLQKIHAKKNRLIAEGKAKSNKSVQPVAGYEQQLALPEGWSWTQLREIVVSSEAGWSPSCEDTPRRDGRWGVLKVSAVSWGSFDSTANKELPLELDPRPELEVRDGDFLLSRANTADLVARSVLVVAPPPMLMLSDKIIRLKLSPLVDARYINLFNNGGDARIYYAERASGTSSSMKNVSREVVLGLPVALPPLAEQARIVARVTELRRLCAALRERLAASQAAQSRLAEALVESVASA